MSLHTIENQVNEKKKLNEASCMHFHHFIFNNRVLKKSCDFVNFQYYDVKNTFSKQIIACRFFSHNIIESLRNIENGTFRSVSPD